MTIAQDICISCGLCCDGSFFSYVTLAKAEAIPPSATSANDGSGFALPCSCLDGMCTIYANRPQTCRDYDCKLLRSVQNGEIKPAAAQRSIAKIKTHIEFIRRHIPAGNFNDALNAYTQRTRSQWRNETYAARNADLIAHITAFEQDRRLFCGVLQVGQNTHTPK